MTTFSICWAYLIILLLVMTSIKGQYDMSILNDNTFYTTAPLKISNQTTSLLDSIYTVTTFGRIDCSKEYNQCLGISNLTIETDFSSASVDADDVPKQECAFHTKELTVNIYGVFNDTREYVELSPSFFQQSNFTMNNTLSTSLENINPWTSKPNSLVLQIDYIITPSCLSKSKISSPIWGKFPLNCKFTLKAKEIDHIPLYRNVTIPIDLTVIQNIRIPAVTNEHMTSSSQLQLYNFGFDVLPPQTQSQSIYPFNRNAGFLPTVWSDVFYLTVTLHDIHWQWDIIDDNLILPNMSQYAPKHCIFNNMLINMTISPDRQTIVSTAPLLADKFGEFLNREQQISFHCYNIFVTKNQQYQNIITLPLTPEVINLVDTNLNMTMRPIDVIIKNEFHSYIVHHFGYQKQQQYNPQIVHNTYSLLLARGKISFVFGDKPLFIHSYIISQGYRVSYVEDQNRRTNLAFDNSTDFNCGFSYSYQVVLPLLPNNQEINPITNRSLYERVVDITLQHDSFWYPDQLDEYIELQDTTNNIIKMVPIIRDNSMFNTHVNNNNNNILTSSSLTKTLNITHPTLAVAHQLSPYYSYYNSTSPRPNQNETIPTPSDFNETYSHNFQLYFNHYIFRRTTGYTINQPGPALLNVEYNSIDLFNTTTPLMKKQEVARYQAAINVMSFEPWSSMSPTSTNWPQNYTSHISGVKKIYENNYFSSTAPNQTIVGVNNLLIPHIQDEQDKNIDPHDKGLLLYISPHYPYYNRATTNPLTLRPIQAIHVQSLHKTSYFDIQSNIVYNSTDLKLSETKQHNKNQHQTSALQSNITIIHRILNNYTIHNNLAPCYLKNHWYDEWVQQGLTLNQNIDDITIQLATSYYNAHNNIFIKFNYTDIANNNNDEDGGGGGGGNNNDDNYYDGHDITKNNIDPTNTTWIRTNELYFVFDEKQLDKFSNMVDKIEWIKRHQILNHNLTSDFTHQTCIIPPCANSDDEGKEAQGLDSILYSSFYIHCPLINTTLNVDMINEYYMDYILIGHYTTPNDMMYTSQLIGDVNYVKDNDNINNNNQDNMTNPKSIRWSKHGLLYPPKAYYTEGQSDPAILSLSATIAVTLACVCLAIIFLIFGCIWAKRCQWAYCCMYFRTRYPNYTPDHLLLLNSHLPNQNDQESDYGKHLNIDYPPIPPEYQQDFNKLEVQNRLQHHIIEQ